MFIFKCNYKNIIRKVSMKKLSVIIILVGICVTPLFLGKIGNKAVGMCRYEQEQKSGCCSRHGGVCGCDKDYHKQKCCDGTLSASCGC